MVLKLTFTKMQGAGNDFVVLDGVSRPVDMTARHAKRIADDMDLPLPEMATGGGSDGNFSAALGIPTLDGLGVVGAGAHAEHEHMLISSLEPRTNLLLRLLETLE